jgi:molybdopterin synthase catalytic subunit
MNAIAVTSQPLDMSKVVGLVSAGGGFGAIASFVGVVRNTNQNRAVTPLEYEAYEPLAVKALDHIRREAAEQWPGAASTSPPPVRTARTRLPRAATSSSA